MKKLLTLIFSLFYLYTAMGVNLNLHYCHGEVDSISFFIEDGKCVCDEYAPKDMVMTCCFDHNYKWEITSEQISSQSIEAPQLSTWVMDIAYADFRDALADHLKYLPQLTRYPPPDIGLAQDISFQILHSVFRL